MTSHGYMKLYAPNHPLADKCGQLYQHQQVLYEKIGPGSHPCHWCGVTVTWKIDLTVDHHNCVKIDNAAVNLFPACAPCNRRRGIAHAWFRATPSDSPIR